MAATVWTTYIVAGQWNCCQQALLAAKSYDEVVQEKKKNHGMGSAHLHFGMAFLEAAAAQQQAEQETEWTAAIKELSESDGGHKEIGRRILYFRVRYLFGPRDSKDRTVPMDKKFCKVIFAMSGSKAGEPLHEGLTSWLHKHGAEEAQGAAPPNNMEREAQKMLQHLH